MDSMSARGHSWNKPQVNNRKQLDWTQCQLTDIAGINSTSTISSTVWDTTGIGLISNIGHSCNGLVSIGTDFIEPGGHS
jgi:hypothetical protein